MGNFPSPVLPLCAFILLKAAFQIQEAFNRGTVRCKAEYMATLHLYQSVYWDERVTEKELKKEVVSGGHIGIF